MFSNQKVQKSPPIFECIICNYNTCRKKDFNKHLLTSKHISNIKQSTDAVKKDKSEHSFQYTLQDKKYECLCGKIYVDNSGLWRHKKKCTTNKKDEKLNILEIVEPKIELKIEPKIEDKMPETFDKEMLIIQLLKQNQDLQKSLIEISKEKMVVNNNNTNNNQTFNLHLFLNEQCKDALNINEFVDSVKVQLCDLETTGRQGYVEGVTRIINKNLNKLDKFKRPIHCSDVKREVLYIKNNNEWVKEKNDTPLLKNAIKQIAKKNIQQISEWRQLNPDCTSSESRKNDLYLKIVSNAMSGSTSEEQMKNYDKIISNIIKGVAIEK